MFEIFAIIEQTLVKIADFWRNFLVSYVRAINVECNYILCELFVSFFPSLYFSFPREFVHPFQMKNFVSKNFYFSKSLTYSRKESSARGVA